jgi:hypothetical protein
VRSVLESSMTSTVEWKWTYQNSHLKGSSSDHFR